MQLATFIREGIPFELVLVASSRSSSFVHVGGLSHMVPTLFAEVSAQPGHSVTYLGGTSASSTVTAFTFVTSASAPYSTADFTISSTTSKLPLWLGGVFTPSLTGLVTVSQPVPHSPPIAATAFPYGIVGCSPFGITTALFASSTSPTSDAIASQLVFLVGPTGAFPRPVSAGMSAPFLVGSSAVSSRGAKR